MHKERACVRASSCLLGGQSSRCTEADLRAELHVSFARQLPPPNVRCSNAATSIFSVVSLRVVVSPCREVVKSLKLRTGSSQQATQGSGEPADGTSGAGGNVSGVVLLSFTCAIPDRNRLMKAYERSPYPPMVRPGPAALGACLMQQCVATGPCGCLRLPLSCEVEAQLQAVSSLCVFIWCVCVCFVRNAGPPDQSVPRCQA